MSTRVRQEPISPLSARNDVSMRLDPSHAREVEVTGEGQSRGSVAAEASGQEEVAAAESRLTTHAQQLSMELNHRLHEIDARENELNMRLAEFDAEMRRSRLWLDERRQEIAEREAELAGRSADQQTRLDRVMAAEAELQEKRETAQREAGIPRAQANVEHEREASIAEFVSKHGPKLSVNDTHRVEPLAGLPFVRMADAEVDERIIDLKARLQAARYQLAEAQRRAEDAEAKLTGTHTCDERLSQRQRQLDEAEALLAVEQSQLADAEVRLDQQRADLAEQSAAERRSLESIRTRNEAEAAARQAAIAEQQEQLDVRAQSLDALRRELAATQRETLELRVATQEVWLQLSGRLAPAHLIQQLATARGQLSEHCRANDRHLEVTRDELREAGDRLAEQLHRLKQQRSELESWAREQHASIERQAGRLVSREQQLDAQEAEFRAASRKWEEQRLALQREIRRLLAEGRRVRVVA